MSGVGRALVALAAVMILTLGLVVSALVGMHRQCEALERTDPAQHAITCGPGR